MREIIEITKKCILQIATPHSTGTGFYLNRYNLIVTNEHVVRDNKEVVIKGEGFNKQMADVIYLDSKHDLAFIAAPEKHEMENVLLHLVDDLSQGQGVIAMGHPFGLEFTATQGIISNLLQEHNGVRYIQHDAALNPGNSGGPLINRQSEIVGVNTFVMQKGNSIGFALPIKYLNDALTEFQKVRINGYRAIRCQSCLNILKEKETNPSYCTFCGSQVDFISNIDEYEPTGPSALVELVLKELGFFVNLSRKGPSAWQINEGSALIDVNYNKNSGMIVGDAVLCFLPKTNIEKIYAYLLQQNFKMDSLCFSIKENSVILSLILHEEYINVETAKELFLHLFKQADHYDDILIDDFNGIPVTTFYK